jgi:hypothetical protein
VRILGGDVPGQLTVTPEPRAASPHDEGGEVDPVPSRRPGGTPWWATPWAPIAAFLALAAALIWRTSLVTTDGRTFTLFDDAMVSMRFARNFAEGHGLVYNAGQTPVEGYTNFLWTLWMSALHLAPVPTRLVPLLVSLSGVGLLIVGVVLVGAITRRLAPDNPAAPAIAMWATALYYPLIFWTLRGLEPGLLSVLIEASVLLVWKQREEATTRRTVGLALVLVAGVLTRTDFVLLAAVVLVWLAWPGAVRVIRRAAIGPGVAVLAAIAAHTAFELAYYGEAVPNTYTLKIAGVGLDTRLARGSAGLGELILAELAIVLVLAVIGLTAPRTPRPRAVLLAALFGMAAAYSVFVGGDAWEYLQYANRYLTPLVPLLFVLAALGCIEIVSWRPNRARLAVLGLGLVALAATAGATALRPDAAGFNLRNDFNTGFMARAHWVALVGGLALFLVSYLLIGRGRTALAAGALAGALMLLVTLPAWTSWADDAGHLVVNNKYETRIGLGLGRIAHGKPTIAVGAGGTIPYWSTLPAVDLLGKSDAVIAAGPSVRGGFMPGHTKWNYRYSICKLRPTLVTQLFQPIKADERLIEGCGYDHIFDNFYLRQGQKSFDRPPLSKLIFGTETP